jgi:hypothetical protein
LVQGGSSNDAPAMTMLVGAIVSFFCPVE